MSGVWRRVRLGARVPACRTSSPGTARASRRRSASSRTSSSATRTSPTTATPPESFARAEAERVWSRVWQWACREEHLAGPGSYYVYDVGDLSAVVFATARAHPGLRELLPAPRHAAQAQRQRGSDQQPPLPVPRLDVVARWSLVTLPCRWDFPHVTDEAFSLPELAVDTWGGFVFVNFDPQAQPLRSYLGVLPRHFENWPLEQRYVEVHARKLLPANWKASAEAFLEAYHVLRTHPRPYARLATPTPSTTCSATTSRGCSTLSASPSPHAPVPPSEQEIVDILLAAQEPGHAPAAGARTVRSRPRRVRRLRPGRHRRAGTGGTSRTCRSARRSTPSSTSSSPTASSSPGRRSRWSTGSDPTATTSTRASSICCSCAPWLPTSLRPHRPSPSTSGSTTATPRCRRMDESLGRVFDQDTDNLAAQTRGLQGQLASAGQTLGNYQEVRTRHFHAVLDRYLAPPSPS